MRVLRENLLVQFSIVSFIIMAAIAVLLANILASKIRSDAVDNLVDEAVGASSGRLISVITPADLETPMVGERYDRFHAFVRRSIVSDRTARIKLWARDGKRFRIEQIRFKGGLELIILIAFRGVNLRAEKLQL